MATEKKCEGCSAYYDGVCAVDGETVKPDGCCAVYVRRVGQKRKPKADAGRRRVVYVASPLRSDTVRGWRRNADYAVAACKCALAEGVVPIAPHLYFPAFLDDDNADERRAGLDAGLEILGRCDELWAFANLGVSEGMRGEIDAARRAGKRVLIRGLPGWEKNKKNPA